MCGCSVRFPCLFYIWASNFSKVALKRDAVRRTKVRMMGKLRYKLVQTFPKTVLIVHFDEISNFYQY